MGWATLAAALNGANGPYLPVDLTPCCMAARPEADIVPYCSILAMEMSALHGNREALPLSQRADCRLVAHSSAERSSADPDPGKQSRHKRAETKSYSFGRAMC